MISRNTITINLYKNSVISPIPIRLNSHFIVELLFINQDERLNPEIEYCLSFIYSFSDNL
jgi:hypothetical protein